MQDAGDPLPTRADLARAELLSRGGWGNPDVLCVAHRGRSLVVKDFAPRGRLVRATLGRWLTHREARAWAALAGHSCVPRFVGQLDALALAAEYRPGRAVTRRLAREELPPGFLARLEAAIAELHAHGVVHLDLHHQGNVLLGDDGAPVLLDFASALVLPPGSRRARLARALLGWIDYGALRKWRRYARAAH
jgi:RIO-like serine/threonine protein kinase